MMLIIPMQIYFVKLSLSVTWRVPLWLSQVKLKAVDGRKYLLGIQQASYNMLDTKDAGTHTQAFILPSVPRRRRRRHRFQRQCRRRRRQRQSQLLLLLRLFLHCHLQQ